MATKPEKVIALTGATGFVGSHVLDEAVSRGFRVRALTRRPRSPRKKVSWIPGDVHDLDALTHLIEGADFVIHGAGVVKAPKVEVFHAVNAEGVQNMCRALARSEAKPSGVILVSSLAAREPHLSPYAASKRKGEELLQEKSVFPWTIVRPPAVYGPRDKEILKLFRAMKRGFAPAFGMAESRFSLIHAADLAALILAALGEKQAAGQTLEPDDAKPGGYTIPEIATAAERILERPVRTIRVHPGVLKGVALVNELTAPLLGDVPLLTRHKVAEMAHPDWVARGGVEKIVPSWEPKRDLETGLAETFAWYKNQGWL